MSSSGPDLENFLQDASEHLQFLREYSSALLDPLPKPEDVQHLQAAAEALCSASAQQGFPLFSEISGKIAHVFRYAQNAALGQDTQGPLAEFLSDAISVLEFDILQISAEGRENAGDLAAFKQRYAFAFSPRGEVARQAEPGAELAEAGAPQTAAGEPDGLALLAEDDEVSEEVLDFFIPEAEEHLQVVTECLLALESGARPDEVHRLFRSIHTLKGSAAQVGLKRLAAIAHRVEDLVGCLRENALTATPEVVDACLESVDVLKKVLHRRWESEGAMRAAVQSLLARISDLIPLEAESEKENLKEVVAADGGTAAISPGHGVPETPQAATRSPRVMRSTKSVRVSLGQLDRMMNAVGELVINRTRMVGRLAELQRMVEILEFSRERLSGKVSEFQDKYEFSPVSNPRAIRGGGPGNGRFPAAALSPQHDFGELEMDRYDDFNILSRSLTEISADVTEVLNQLNGFAGRVDSDIDEFTKLAHHLQDEITQARMVPIGNLYTRLSRTVRDAAKETRKQVELELRGEETELDNNIIQQISDPLVHLVRNAVAHGIESPERRTQGGKAARGKIEVRAYHRGNHIHVEVEDDGQGIAYESVRRRAIEAGIVSPSEGALLNDRDLRNLLFHPGISTAEVQTELSGRGVGLDVVRANLGALNGEVDVRTECGQGTCFTLKVPLTLIISPALFVRCSGAVFALPLAVVEEIRRLKQQDIEEVGGKLLTKVREVVTEVVRLDRALALPPIEPVNGYFRMVIASAGGRQIGVVVEEVMGKDEIVIKNLGEYMRRVKLFPGTTIAPDGSLILLIDLNRLMAGETAEQRALVPSASAARIFAPGAAAVASGSIPSQAIDAIPSDKMVVVADDSISVRKFVGRMLEKAGYRVKLASDGLEASEVIAQFGCHLLVTDLEMPRMNGYELMAHLRQDRGTRHIPVLVVTSRAGAKHRERAMKEGAAGFMTKPVQEEQLVSMVAQLIGASEREPADSSLAPVS